MSPSSCFPIQVSRFHRIYYINNVVQTTVKGARKVETVLTGGQLGGEIILIHTFKLITKISDDLTYWGRWMSLKSTVDSNQSPG